MEIESARELNQQINNIKILYEEFLKTVSRFVCDDVEILVLDYMIERSKEGELEFEDEKIAQVFKFDSKSVNAAFPRLSKSKLIEIKERNLGIIDEKTSNQANMRMMDRNSFKFPKKKTVKFYRLNPRMKKEFPVLLEKLRKIIEKDLRYEYVCKVCKNNYKSEEVVETNLRLEPGKFICLDSACRTYLHELTEEETKTSNAAMTKIIQALNIMQNRFDCIKDKEWPFKKKTNNLKNENNQEQNHINGNNNGEGREKFKVECEESNRESWEYKIFKIHFLEKYRRQFDYMQFVDKTDKKEKILKKLEEGKNKNLESGRKKRITHDIILENRRRFVEISDLEYEKLYKKLKK